MHSLTHKYKQEAWRVVFMYVLGIVCEVEEGAVGGETEVEAQLCCPTVVPRLPCKSLPAP